MLSACGIEESEHKAYAPSTRMEFLGIVCDSVKLTLEISGNRILEIKSLLREWDEKPKATKRTIQSLVGKRFLFLLLSNCNLFSVLIFTHVVHPLVTAIGSHTYKSLYANQGI